MVFIIINTTNQKVERILARWKEGNSRKYVQKYFIRKMGPGTYLMNANAAVLTILYDLKIKYGGSVYIFVADTLDVENEFPKEVVNTVKECKEKKRESLEKKLERLEKIRIRCSVSWSPKL